MAKLFRQIIFVIVVILVLQVAVQAQPKKCPRNQEWQSCGTACPLKCNQPQPKFCTYQCVIGCQCKNGYMLNINGDCVLARDC